MSKHLSDHHGAHTGATSPCQFTLVFKAQSGTAQWTSADKDTAGFSKITVHVHEALQHLYSFNWM